MKGFWRRKVPACLLALAMMAGMVPAASAAWSDIEVSVDAGDEVSFTRSEFRDIFKEEYDKGLDYLAFDSYDDLDRYGHLEALDEDGDWVTLNEEDLSDAWFCYRASDISYSSDYQMDDLTFVADKNAPSGTLEMDFDLWNEDDDRVKGTLYIDIDKSSSSGSSKADIVYEVEADDDVSFDRADFLDFFEDESNEDIAYVVFDNPKGLDDWGELYSYNYDEDRVYFGEKNLDDGWFYYSSGDLDKDSYEEDCTLNDLTFVADRDADGETVTMDFVIYGDESDEVEGTLEIRIGDVKTTSGSSVKADLVFHVDPDDDVTLDAGEFDDFFWDESDDDTLEWIEFTGYDDFDDYGWFEADGWVDDDDVRGYELYERDLDDAKFYYDPDDAWYDYEFELGTLTFCTDRDADEDTLTFDVTMHGEDGDKIYATVAIVIGGGSGGAGGGDIIYRTGYSSRLQINANDIANFFSEHFPGQTLRYVTFDGAPEAGALYYNYYATSDHGVSVSMRMTDALCEETDFYFSPTGSQYALSELTYVPSGVNYCTELSFTAYGSGSRSVSGTIFISVNLSTVPEVYGPTPANQSVTFPAASLAAAVSQASGVTLSGIRLLELPDPEVGTIYVGSGTSRRADTDTVYGYTSGSERMGQLRFVPASGYTGSVEIPYAACSGSGTAFASGYLCLGVIREMENFSDIDSSTWCYKYVLELSDAGIIDGYSDGTFKPGGQVTWGAALKLVMLAAGYDQQQPVGSGGAFSGYLAKAREDGLVSGSVDLSAPITRLAVAQLAAKALDLSITNLSSVRPFTDTTDPYVQALNAVGVVGGYFSNGTSTYKPYNTLTRGAMSAIVWRMQQL